MDLLLDVNVVLDICAKRQPFYTAARDAIQLCKFQGGKLWLYVGSVQTLQYNLYKEIKRQQESVETTRTNRQLHEQCLTLLKTFAEDKHWLAALAIEGNVFSAGDPEDVQLLLALDRFAENKIKLLTRDLPLLNTHPDKTITPQAFIKQSLQVASEPTIDFIDLKTQQDAIRPALEKNIHRVLNHGQYVMGPEVVELEAKLADYVGVKHCISASSGTDTLMIAMMALGIGAGDEVITTPFTFIATGEMIALLGAVPVFVDIDPRTYNIDPAKIEAAITPKTKAIMPVSLYGQCADFDAINAIADKHGLPVIEDAAQSFGATYKGKKSCNLSSIGSTSFFPSKPLGAYGDGGALFTNDDALAKIMREIRAHGQEKHYYHSRVGINGRLDTLQAAVLLAKMEIFPDEVESRQRIAGQYNELLNGVLVTPYVAPFNTSVYAQYTVLIDNRAAVQQRLKDIGVPTAVHYPIPLNLQPVFKSLNKSEGSFPISESIANRVMSLPMSPYLSSSLINRIAKAVLEKL